MKQYHSQYPHPQGMLPQGTRITNLFRHKQVAFRYTNCSIKEVAETSVTVNNCSQQLPAPYKRLNDGIKQTKYKRTTGQLTMLPSITFNNNSAIQDYVHPDDHTQPIYEMTPGVQTFHSKK